MSCCLFSCSSLARPSFPFPPTIALNNFGVSCFCPKRLAKPRGCCTGGPGGGFPFVFSSTLETGRNENTQHCCETEQSSCKTKMSYSWMKIWQLFRPIFFGPESSGKSKAGNGKGKPPELEATAQICSCLPISWRINKCRLKLRCCKADENFIR